MLWVATKPPWPERDGGRLLLAETLRAVARDGHEIHLVAPADRDPSAAASHVDGCIAHLIAAPSSSPLAVVGALWRATPVTIARHTRPALRAEVARLLDTLRFDVVHAEQLHAFAQCRPALERDVPVILRAQNVESDLWAGVAARRSDRARPIERRVWGRLLRRERARIAAYEGAVVRRAAATVAITRDDAVRLAALAGNGAVVHTVAAPFASDARTRGPELPGSPAIVLLGTAAWLPNADGARWFVRNVWPAVRARLPHARLHLFTVGARTWRDRGARAATDDECVAHPAPAASAAAFAAGAIVVVPLRIASGVRMKILEAWARGLPVIATPEAAAGLDAEPGRELMIARDGAEFAAALATVHTDPARRAALVRHGHAFLRAHHDPATIAAQLVAIADGVASAARARR
jgi:hypothetical protein